MQIRPDIAYTIITLSKYINNPDNTHWQVLKQIWRYLKKTKNLGYYYKKGDLNFTGWTDSSWDKLLEDRKSISGYIFLLAGGPVSWASAKQATVTTSTTVAEYYAQYFAATELAWIRDLLVEIGAVDLTRTTAYHKRSKHIAVRYHWTREIIKEKALQLEYLPTGDILADRLTKPLSNTKFKHFIKLLNLKSKEDIIHKNFKN